MAFFTAPINVCGLEGMAFSRETSYASFIKLTALYQQLTLAFHETSLLAQETHTLNKDLIVHVENSHFLDQSKTSWLRNMVMSCQSFTIDQWVSFIFVCCI